MDNADGTALSSILIGDIMTPHEPGEPFEYVSSVLVLGGELKQVVLPDALGEYPANPCGALLSSGQFAAIEAAATEAEPAAVLLARTDDETLMVCPDFGDANLRAYLAEHNPELLGDPAVQEEPEPQTSRWITALVMAVVAAAIIVLLGLGATVAFRVVNGF